MPSVATSLQEAAEALAAEEYREEMAVLEAEEAVLHKRLRVYDPAVWPAAEEVLRYWRDHFVETYIHASEPEKRLVAQGRCLAIEEILGGRKDVEAAIRELVKSKQVIEQRYGIR